MAAEVCVVGTKISVNGVIIKFDLFLLKCVVMLLLGLWECCGHFQQHGYSSIYKFVLKELAFGFCQQQEY